MKTRMNKVSQENPFNYNIPSSNKDLTTIPKKNNFVDDYSDDMLPHILADKNMSSLNNTATGKINISKSSERIPNNSNLRINKADITSMMIQRKM